MCEFMKVSRSGYYDWRKREISGDEKKLLDMILDCEKKHKNCYGYRRVTMWIRRKYGIKINHKRVYRIMQKNGIQSVIRKKRHKKLACNGDLRYGNILSRNFVSQKPNEKWVTDITYIPTAQGTCYLSVIGDLCGGYIVGYKYDTNQRYNLVEKTLDNAFAEESPSNLILHSDGESQYRSYAYHKYAKEKGVTISMSAPGTPGDNACAENFYSIFKTECLYLEKPQTIAEAYCLIDNYIHYYNNVRITSNGYTPAEIRQMAMLKC